MRKLLAVAVPALLLLAAPMPGQAETSQPRASQRAAAGVDSGAGDLVPSRDLIGKRVVHRHGGPVAGVIQDVATGADGQSVITLKVANTDRSVTLGPSDFERRGKTIVLMHDRDEINQLAQYGQTTGGFGSSTGSAPMGNAPMGNMTTPGMGAGQ